MFVVVLGHMLEAYNYNYYNIYLFIYSFHMPLFIFISGYLAKHINIRKIMNFLLLYLIFQPLFYLFNNIITKSTFTEIDYIVPFYHLWYLVSMMSWYLFVFVVLQFKSIRTKKAVIILLSFVISYLSRFFTADLVQLANEFNPEIYSYSYSFQRTLTFAPYFLLGFFMGQDK